MNNNIINKESIQLLNASSSESDSLPDTHFTFVPPQPPVQVRRKVRTKRKSRRDLPQSRSPFLPCSLEKTIKTAAICFVVGATLALGWILILLHSQIRQLSQKLSDVTSNNNEETILELRQTVRELGLNQTANHLTIQNCSKTMEEFHKQTGSIVLDVSTIKDSLKEAPQMLNIGKELDSLKNRIATYEATVSDLKLSLKDLRDSLSSNIMETIRAINSTMETSVQGTIKDLHNHHSLISSMGEGLRNVSDQLVVVKESEASDRARVDVMTSAFAQLEFQQKNNTRLLDHILKVVHKLEPLPLQRLPQV